jgi:hypothetical protein
VHEEDLVAEVRILAEANREMRSRKKTCGGKNRNPLYRRSSMPKTRREDDGNLFNPENYLPFVKDTINELIRENTKVVLKRGFSINAGSGLHVSSTPTISVGPTRDVFGYDVFFCPDCQTWEPQEVYFTYDFLHQEQQSHLCPKKPGFIHGYHGQGLSAFARHLEKPNPSRSELCGIAEEFLLRQCHWRSWSNASLFAIKEFKTLPDGMQLGVLTLPHPIPQGKPDKVIVLSSKCIPLSIPSDASHWLRRLLKDTSTSISINEFREFLTLSLGATFLFFKIVDQAEETSIIGEKRALNEVVRSFVIIMHGSEWNNMAKLYKQFNESEQQKTPRGTFSSLLA